ncbi:MAG: hypothetical protein AABX47_03930 [Nanoarchaeota archaeon]
MTAGHQIIRSKKGQMFSIGLNLAVIFFLVWAYVALAGRQTATTKQGQVGDSAAVLMSMNSITDQAQLFSESAAALAAEQALLELARRGGMGEKDNCGIVNGYSLWNTPDKTLSECYPDPFASFKTHFVKSFNEILATYASPSGDWIDARRQFDIGLLKHNEEMILTATSAQPLAIPIKNKKGETLATPTIYLSATTKIPDVADELSTIREGAKTILEKCAETSTPYDCATEQVYILNTAPGATIKWKTGPCPGDLAPPDTRIVQFCAQSDRRMLTRKTGTGSTTWAYSPTLYKFALTVVKKSPVKIINFQANGVPTSGKPNDKGGMGLLTGQPLSYHGRLSSPGLDGLTVSLCQTETAGNKKTCYQVPPAQWDVETYPATQQLTVSGAWQPTVNPPFTLTLTAERKEQKDITAGIDIVPITPILMTPNQESLK